MKKEMNARELASYAKYMIYPDNIDSHKDKLSYIGEAAFSEYPYRMRSHRYRASSAPSESELLRLLCSSLLKTGEDKKPLLLLSDGKDSMSIALAYSKLGISIDTLTLLREDDEELKSYITGTCEKLGHKASFVTVSDIISYFDQSDFLNACRHMESPVLDQGLIFFLFGIKRFFALHALTPSDYILVDGLGNDETFGYIPSKQQLLSLKLSSLGLWKLIPSRLGFLKWFFRSPAESHGDLSALSCFYPLERSYDINEYFEGIKSRGTDESVIDFRAFSRGAFHDHQCMMGKVRTSADFLGTSCYFPWLDTDLVHYVFNLPKEYKFDFPKLKNKILLRSLLSNELGWEQNKRGIDLYFDLSLQGFVNNVSNGVVPDKIINIILKSKFTSGNVKKRACLELMNFYGYCLAHDMSDVDIERVLFS